MSHKGLLVCMVYIHGAIQIVFPPSLRQHILIMSHCSQIAAHPGQRQTYDKFRETFYWLRMAAVVNYVMQDCTSCARNNSNYRHKCDMYLFPELDPPEFVAMDIVGPFPKTTRGSQYILLICIVSASKDGQSLHQKRQPRT